LSQRFAAYLARIGLPEILSTKTAAAVKGKIIYKLKNSGKLEVAQQRQFMKALESGAFGQDQAHRLAKVIFG
jgi:hypothetical protein